MDDFLSSVLLKGGPVALVIGIALAIKYASEGVSNWRKSRTSDTTAEVTDAATTNAMLLDSLRLERSDNARKDRRIVDLEGENGLLRNQLYEQQRQYEEEIGDLRSKLQEITLQLEALQERVSHGRPAPRPQP